ncbi:MAG: hypothetical protein K6E84_06780 [Lachnospiraceae bacterium]|nr:hypothetical protein [Lachnospiraceae bacterium]
MNASDVISLLYTMVLLVVVLHSIRLISATNRSMKVIFFAFAVVGLALDELYWLTYGILRPDTRMPFAANEIGEWAFFLLLGASLTAPPARKPSPCLKEILFCVLFSACNIALWIGWSGEWGQDIITGIVICYFFSSLLISVKGAGYLTDRRFGVVAAVCLPLVLMQGLTFFVDGSVKTGLDLACYVYMFAGCAFLLYRLAYVIRKGSERNKAGFLACGLFAWSTTSMYMSSGYFYLAMLCVCMISIVLMLYTLKKEVEAE